MAALIYKSFNVVYVVSELKDLYDREPLSGANGKTGRVQLCAMKTSFRSLFLRVLINNSLFSQLVFCIS